LTKNIFIGYQDVCSTIREMSDVYTRQGYKVFTAVHEQAGIFDQSEIDFNIQNEIKKYYNSFLFKLRYRFFKENAVDRVKQKLLDKIIRENDIFIIYHPTINADFSDFEKIKKAGKKLICLIYGDDVRWYNAMKQWNQERNIPVMHYDEAYLGALTVDGWIGYMRQVEKYADIILSHPDTAHTALRPYYHFYIQINTQIFLPGSEQRKIKPVVAHAPSDKKIKGTEYVLRAVKELQEEGLDFEFRLMEKVPYNAVYDFYKDIDIMVVQLLAHGGGKQSYELLSCGKVVISKMQYNDYLPHIKEECPIIDADISTIKNVLRETILNYDRRVALSAKGRDYVLKYHDVNVFCKNILHTLQSPQHKADYVPTFFREEYIPAENEIEDLNKWTSFVSNCDWYKKNIAHGARAGLKF
jgi:glycosyltransferase involved in cell wall biosynthesis